MDFLVSFFKRWMISGLFLGVVALPLTSSALEKFVCTCQATGPGVERDIRSVKKFCSYDCNCIGLNSSGPAVMNLPAKIENVETTSYSLEEWDYKSQTCHGQYAWRPSFDAPAWKIKAKFTAFTISSEGVMIFPESIETAQGVNEQGKRFKDTAPEIVQALRQQLL
jgi:hypothetical protein